MAAEMGGNTELTEAGKEIVTDNGVRIIGFTNLPATMPGSATQMYAKNIQTLVEHLLKDGTLELDFADEITAGATITHDGKVVHEATAAGAGDRAQAGRGGSGAGGRIGPAGRHSAREGRRLMSDASTSTRSRWSPPSSSWCWPPSSATRSSPRCRPCSTRR